MPAYMSRGMLKRMEERNIKWEDVDELCGVPRKEDLDAVERASAARDSDRGLRSSYRQYRRS